jgi:hypothetical protein
MIPLHRTGVLIIGLGGSVLFSLLPVATAQQAVETTGVEVQTRGIIHEAFAQPYDVSVQTDPVVPKQPPAPVPEDPPDVKPEGKNVEWIPGYWAWDADANEFIWISGFYRDAPPGRVYVAGYWQQTADGWRWVHGFWAPADQAELPYQQPPPASLEIGPTVPPPGDDYLYVPGCWVWRDIRYVWRPGYWMQCRAGMIWTPACYSWTPAGCVYVSGYWDYPLEQRGLLFAPICFNRPLWNSPDWCWRPSYALSVAGILDALFVDTHHGRYRYGDWYGQRYRDRGYRAWHEAGTKHFDPLYAGYRVSHRGDSGWQTGLVTTYNNRVAGKASLPPRTFADQTALAKTANVNHKIALPPTQIAASNNLKLVPVTQAQRVQTQTTLAQVRDASVARHKIETAKVGGAGTSTTLKVTQNSGRSVVDTKTVVGPKIDVKSPPVTKTPDVKLPKMELKNNNPSGPVIDHKTVQPPPTKVVQPATVNKVQPVVNKSVQSAPVHVQPQVTKTVQSAPVHVQPQVTKTLQPTVSRAVTQTQVKTPTTQRAVHTPPPSPPRVHARTPHPQPAHTSGGSDHGKKGK